MMYQLMLHDQEDKSDNQDNKLQLLRDRDI